MPINEDGEIPDIILNSLGVMNRLNPPQLFEQEINFMGNEIVKQIQNLKSLESQEELYLNFIYMVCPEMGDMLEAKFNTMKITIKKNFFKNIHKEGIHTIVPPFFNNPDFMNVTDIYKVFGIDRKIFYDPDNAGVKLEGAALEGTLDKKGQSYFGRIGRKICIGEVYFMRLMF